MPANCPANSFQISRLVVFGDSLSDNGNLLQLIGPDLFGYIVPEAAWEGRYSNGPTYAEQLAEFFGAPLEDHAIIGAEASDESQPLLPLPPQIKINLSYQVDEYVRDLGSASPPVGTTALINIGSNDYLAYLLYGLPNNHKFISDYATKVVGSVEQAIDDLTVAGIKQIIVFTLPDLGTTPLLQGMGPEAVEFAHALSEANNEKLTDMAQTINGPDIRVVDIYQLSRALSADPRGFGFSDELQTTWVNGGSLQFAPDGVLFFNDVHPTTAAHGVSAAFANAVLTSDHVQYLDGKQTVTRASRGNDFIFATPIEATSPNLDDDYTIYGGPGRDVIFAGSGNVKVYGGSGNDLLAAGSGNPTLVGGRGTDVLATNSTGRNFLDGGEGGDALIANRGGTNTLIGGPDHDLFILKEGADLVTRMGDFNFGKQQIFGGAGHDTLRFIINDQNPFAESLFISEFKKIEFAFEQAHEKHHSGAFELDGLHVENIERIELQVDSVSKDSNTPYVITHDIIFSEGENLRTSTSLNNLLQTAESWNLLSVGGGNSTTDIGSAQQSMLFANYSAAMVNAKSTGPDGVSSAQSIQTDSSATLAPSSSEGTLRARGLIG